ncbi:phage baseplate assembly protein V [Paenibacillus cisolokensis]|uniref:phage baseplate assembly protein V n=1 Tax=Paenibacillus cisolokensis TaxID=1658519 RepID=UPI003D2B1E41
MLSSIIRVGIVSAVDTGRMALRATFPDRDDQVSDWLQLVMPPLQYDQYTSIKMPAVGQQVLCLFLGNGLETGYWLGTVGESP